MSSGEATSVLAAGDKNRYILLYQQAEITRFAFFDNATAAADERRGSCGLSCCFEVQEENLGISIVQCERIAVPCDNTLQTSILNSSRIFTLLASCGFSKGTFDVASLVAAKSR